MKLLSSKNENSLIQKPILWTVFYLVYRPKICTKGVSRQRWFFDKVGLINGFPIPKPRIPEPLFGYGTDSLNMDKCVG